MLQQAVAIGNDKALSRREKVEAIRHKVQEALTYPKSEENRAKFEELNRRHRLKAVSLGEYLKIGTGDCRAFAATTQLMLQAAGIESYLTYGKTSFLGLAGRDHAFNVLKRRKDLRVVDSLKPYYHNAPLAELTGDGHFGMRLTPHPSLPFVYKKPDLNTPG